MYAILSLSQVCKKRMCGKASIVEREIEET